jgi:hypothetical protein
VARFDAAGGGGGGDDGGYLPGDVYTFRAAALAAAALGDADAHPELQPGSIKPGVLTAVAVSCSLRLWSATGELLRVGGTMQRPAAAAGGAANSGPRIARHSVKAGDWRKPTV